MAALAAGRPATLVTARLRLRPSRPEDLDSLHALWTEPGVRRYLWDDEVISREKAEETLRAGIESFDRGGFGLWSVFPVSGGALVGFCGLRRFGDESEVEVLFGIRPDVWGCGLATEAATAVLTRVFREDGLAKVYAGADASNPASFRVMEKLGMRFAEHARR